MTPQKTFLPAYTISNEDLRWATTQIPNSARVLTTAGSGDQALFYKLAGAHNIDTFDISGYARVIQDIKTTAIKILPREEYIQLINELHTTRGAHPVKHLPEILHSLPGPSIDIMRKYPDSQMFAAGCAAKDYPYNLPTESEYKRLQSDITEPFNFILSDLGELHTKINTEYDLINLSNIFDKCYDGEQQGYILANLVRHVRVGGHILYLPQHQRYNYNDIKFTWKSGIEVTYKNTIVNPQNRFAQIIVFERTR